MKKCVFLCAIVYVVHRNTHFCSNTHNCSRKLCILAVSDQTSSFLIEELAHGDHANLPHFLFGNEINEKYIV